MEKETTVNNIMKKKKCKEIKKSIKISDDLKKKCKKLNKKKTFRLKTSTLHLSISTSLNIAFGLASLNSPSLNLFLKFAGKLSSVFKYESGRLALF